VLIFLVKVRSKKFSISPDNENSIAIKNLIHGHCHGIQAFPSHPGQAGSGPAADPARRIPGSIRNSKSRNPQGNVWTA